MSGADKEREKCKIKFHSVHSVVTRQESVVSGICQHVEKAVFLFSLFFEELYSIGNENSKASRNTPKISILGTVAQHNSAY